MHATPATNWHNSWVVANWKMNPTTHATTAQLLNDLIKQPVVKDVNLVVAPSFIHLSQVHEVLLQSQSSIMLAAQDVCAYHAEQGAFTGEVCAAQLADAGVSFVIIGHSERRQYFAEDNTLLSKKIEHALSQNLNVILCIGETAEQYDANQTQTIIAEQLTLLQQIKIPTQRLIVAYEPVWAIGTGKVPTVAEVDTVHAFIKQTLATYQPTLSETPVLYGGSVKADNAKDFAQSPNVGGVLVGGASLNAESFSQIVDAFAQK